MPPFLQRVYCSTYRRKKGPVLCLCRKAILRVLSAFRKLSLSFFPFSRLHGSVPSSGKEKTGKSFSSHVRFCLCLNGSERKTKPCPLTLSACGPFVIKHTRAHTDTNTHTHRHRHKHTHSHAHMCAKRKDTHMHTHTHARTNTHTHTDTNTRVHAGTQAWTHTHTCIHTHKHRHPHAYTHT